MTIIKSPLHFNFPSEGGGSRTVFSIGPLRPNGIPQNSKSIFLGRHFLEGGALKTGISGFVLYFLLETKVRATIFFLRFN